MAASMSFSILCFQLVLTLPLLLGDDEFEGISSLPVEHTFDTGPNPSFSRRGVITITSLSSNLAQFSQEAPLSDQQKQQLKSLVQTDGIYRLRVPTKVGNTDEKTLYVSTYMKACALYESKLSDILTLSVDQVGNIIGINTRTYLPYCQGSRVSSSELSQFNTSIEVSQTVNGPVPDTQSYVKKMEQQKAAKEKGQQQDNRSFFAKYWMYLVPLFLFLMLSSAADGGGGGS